MRTTSIYTSFLLGVAFLLFGCNSKSQKDGDKAVNKTPTVHPVKITDNYFTINGDSVVFQGLCLEDLGELEKIGHWNEEYIKQAAQWNINIVRFPVHPSHYNRLGKENYFKELEKGINWAAKYGLYSIIDWHVIGNLKEEKWQDPMYKTTMEETLDFWNTAAKIFGKNNHVAFYELYNEPTVYQGKLGSMNWDELMNIYHTILDTIHVYDTTTIALLGGFNWSYDLKPLKNYTPTLQNIAFVAHPYPQKSPQPWEEKWEEYFGFVTENYPVFATEFGFSYKDQEGAHIPVMGDEEYGQAILDYFKKRGISYTLWVYSWHWYPNILKDSTFTLNEGQGEFFFEKFKEIPLINAGLE